MKFHKTLINSIMLLGFTFITSNAVYAACTADVNMGGNNLTNVGSISWSNNTTVTSAPVYFYGMVLSGAGTRYEPLIINTEIIKSSGVIHNPTEAPVVMGTAGIYEIEACVHSVNLNSGGAIISINGIRYRQAGGGDTTRNYTCLTVLASLSATDKVTMSPQYRDSLMTYRVLSEYTSSLLIKLVAKQ